MRPGRPLLLIALFLLALPAAAWGQLPADVYPGAVPVAPPPASLGPVPDVQPLKGQDPTPEVLRNCRPAPLPAGVPGVDARAVSSFAPNPLEGLRFFVDPKEPAFEAYARYKNQGREREAALLWKTAGHPRFRWFGRWTRPNMQKKVREYLNCVSALQPGAVPLMTVMRHQGQRCSPRYTAGGRAEDARTRRWYDEFAEALGDARVVIAFEPDSLGTVECLKKSRRKSRLDNLRYGVNVLSQKPNVTMYLEAGASDWEPARKTARQLRYIGISKVRGFMLNVTHYDWTANNIKHGLKLSRLTGGKHFIISTAFNGRGPVHIKRWVNRKKHLWRRLNVWCHPLKRGLGPSPTTATAHRKVDAYMYIGRPGFSGGACNGGPMPVGTFWNERALMFGTFATNWLRPPRGSRNGHFRRYSPRALGHCGHKCT